MGKASVKPRKSSRKSARPAKRGKGTKAPAAFSRLFRWTAKWTAVVAVWGVVALIAAAAWYAYDLPDVDRALAQTRRPAITVLAADGMVLATLGDDYGQTVGLDDLPPVLPQAVLATEDRRFYGHFGLDPLGLARAVAANIREGRIVQGGSTITQQVAKNLFLTPERTFKRKVQEVMLALWLENKLTKDEILTVYLNRVYLGAGTYGVDAAARKYFGRPASQVSVYQAALLAGLLQAPSRYNPLRNPGLSARRTARVLDKMVAAGYLKPATARAAKKNRGRVASSASRSGRYFVDWVLDLVPGYVAPGNRDLTIITTLDADLQRRAETRVESLLAAQGGKSGASQAALVAIAPDGAVRAMVGGRDYGKSQYNRATQAIRQPGSAFKPFVYLAGLESGLTPETMFTDEPVTVAGWTPRNFSGAYKGPVSMETALAHSINTVAVTVAEQVGRGRVIEAARRLGVTAPMKPRPSLALGAAGVTLLELTAAYGPFANGGIGVWPFGIQAIRDGRGNELYRRAGSGPGRVMEKETAAAMNRMLSAAIRQGTGRAAQLSRSVAGKTGTSQGYRDAWFIGYSADLITGVWLGNDDGSPMKKVTGGGLPARLWRAFMEDAHAGTPDHSLPGLAPPPAVPVAEEGSFWRKILVRFGAGAG